MELTRQQTAAILGIGARALQRLIDDGKLKPLNDRKPGAAKFYMKFDQAAVRALKRDQAASMKRAPKADDQTIALLVAWAEVDPEKRPILVKLADKYDAAELELLLTL